LAETLLTLGTVANEARVARGTVYSWLTHGLVRPRYRVENTPVFTPQERDAITALAKERKECRTRLRLSPSEG
jgi:hypothetical protein